MKFYLKSVTTMIRFSLILPACLLFMLFCAREAAFALAGNPMKAPYFKRATERRPFYQTSALKFAAKNLIDFYSKVISPVDGPRSPSYPTGTEYGRQVIERRGFIVGIILIADRLFHEADENLNPIINIHGVDRYFDPPENNTFWWDKPERNTKRLDLKQKTTRKRP